MNLENLGLIDIDEITNLLQVDFLGFLAAFGIFIAVIIFNALFFNYKVYSFPKFFAWFIASIITFIYILNDDVNSNLLAINLNAQVILSFLTNATMLVCALLSKILNTPQKRGKNYGKHGWYKILVIILGFIVRVAFYSAFNIALFVFALFFYL
ncbi:hypothetical protein DCO58_02360 [Helicobacter saguini]|uniref:Uncharacterized protein n=1 Tax=Helicobacter saguini TaxID=1548018 RepID=A0A4U8T2J9_9HELI|nr:hypothetical protein [Helicobacter saguini]MWV62780.1 hypothetical protein [Helicobacter saguini]MWV66550.1 hypothetical protein [Helicobacter saguini]MWV68900.1 hypothetical protein [Helicobacter saguini]MWV71546.1 hypothetical protein [Helicobacter saguini]TLD93641.1 hypothetical protein LS64_008415 [Helicobacter saguini]